MTVGDVCTRGVATVVREDSVLEVARIMRDRHVGNVVVVDGEGMHKHPIGILTDRDIVVAIVALAPDKLSQLLVGDVFTRDVLTIAAEDSIETALQTMSERGIRRLPVVDFAGRLRGILTFDDVVGVMAQQLTELAQVVRRERQREEQLRA
jgi:CBS domain-containing protein